MCRVCQRPPILQKGEIPEIDGALEVTPSDRRHKCNFSPSGGLHYSQLLAAQFVAPLHDRDPVAVGGKAESICLKSSLLTGCNFQEANEFPFVSMKPDRQKPAIG